MSQEMAVCANLLNADRQAFIKAMLTKMGESGSTLTVIYGQATLSCFAFFRQGRCPMTEAGWTGEPKREGVYWFRWDKDRDAIIVVVLMEYGDWRVMEMGHQYSGALTGYRSGQFLGPISPTDRQQGRVEGLREATAIICEFCADSDYWAPMSNSGYHCGVNGSKLRRCKAERIYERITETNAQAAQDEKGVGDVHG